MAYTFKARCVSTNQNPGGSHLATLTGGDGTEVVIPSKDLMFEVGSEYSITVDGKFAPVKVAPKAAAAPLPKPVVTAVAKPVAPVAPKPQPVVAPKPPAPKP